MKNIAAFFNGMKEFRLSFTTHYENDTHIEWYDRGREFMHLITFRHFEQY